MDEDRERRVLEWWFRHQPADHPLVRVLFQIALERATGTRPEPPRPLPRR
ncbi:MAG: hypothetical protein ABMA64_11300 [Myxococcota bacterium]